MFLSFSISSVTFVWVVTYPRYRWLCCHLQCCSGWRRARQRQADARPEAGPWLGPGQGSVCQVPEASTLVISSFLPTFLPSEDDAQVYAAAV